MITFLKKLGREMVALAPIIFLSIFSFVGFQAVFSSLNQNIALEAIVAAFGALFVLLPTKFLLNHESEKRIENEKTAEVFKDNLKLYKEASSLFLDTLDDQKITPDELSKLRKAHASLIILGSREVIEASGKFILKCQHIIQNSDQDNDVGVQIEKDDLTDLWDKAYLFLECSRKGLSGNHFDGTSPNQRDTFDDIIANEQTVTEKFRQAIKDTAYFKLRNVTEEEKKLVNTFVEVIKEENPYLQEKFTASTISVANTQSKGNRNVLYIDIRKRKTANLSEKGSTLRVGFPEMPKSDSEKKKDQMESDFVRSQRERLDTLVARGVVKKHEAVRNNKRWGLGLEFPIDEVKRENILIISQIIKEYIAEFHVQSD